MTRQRLQIHAADLKSTDRFGTALANTLPPGTVVALVGTLGAGKTRLVQAFATAVGVPADDVTSPTFVLVNEYVTGRVPIYHFDTYRLRDDDEFLELGPEEYFDGSGITFVEWADRVIDCLPLDYLRIEIKVVTETARDFVVSASSAAMDPLLKSINEEL